MIFKKFKMKPRINDYNKGDKLPYMYSRSTYTILDLESDMVLLIRNNIILYKGDILGLQGHNIPNLCIDINMNKLEPGIINRCISEKKKQIGNI